MSFRGEWGAYNLCDTILFNIKESLIMILQKIKREIS